MASLNKRDPDGHIMIANLKLKNLLLIFWKASKDDKPLKSLVVDWIWGGSYGHQAYNEFYGYKNINIATLGITAI